MKIKKSFKNFTKKIGNIAFAVLTAVGTTIVSPVTEVHAASLSDGDHSGLVSAGIKYLGASYSTADRLGPSSFDCSGFVDRLASDAGLDSTPLNEGWTTDSWVTYFANAGVSYAEVASQDAAANIDVNAGDIKSFYGIYQTKNKKGKKKEGKLSMNKETLKNYLGKRILHIQGCETPEDLDMARICYGKDDGNIMIRYSNKFKAEYALDLNNPVGGLKKAAEFYRNFSISDDFIEDYQEFINFCDGAPVNKRMFFYYDHKFVPVISFQDYKHQELEEQAKELEESYRYFVNNGMKNTKLFTVLKKEKARVISELDRDDLEKLYKDECDSYNDYRKYIFDDPATNAYDTVKWYITHTIPLELEGIAEELEILLGEDAGESKKEDSFDCASDACDYDTSEEYEELLKNLDRTVEVVKKIVSIKKGKGGKK